MSLIYHEVVETHSCVLGTSEAISVYQIKSHILDRFWILQSYKGYFGAKQSQPSWISDQHKLVDQVSSFWEREKKYIHFIIRSRDKSLTCIDGHLWFLIDKKTTNFLEGQIRKIHILEQFHHTCGFREENIWNFIQPEGIICLATMLYFWMK